MKLKEEEEKRRFEKEMIDELRTELYKEEYEENERRKEREEAEKRQRYNNN